MSSGGRGRTARYARYAGGPDPLAPPVDLRDALDAIGEDVMAGTSPERAMRELLRQGTASRVGLDELARKVAQRRRELLQRHSLGGTLDEVRRLLDEAVLAERKQLARDLDDDARFAEMRIDGLPASPAAAVTELADYPWRSSDAREKYEQIKDLLGRELLDQRFAGMKQALENATPEDRERVEQMLRDLNDLLAAHARGDDTTEQFRDFMDQHGDFFPEGPETVDELVDALAARAAAAQRMLASMTPEQRAELAELSQQAFGSPGLMDQLSTLDDALRSPSPGRGLGRVGAVRRPAGPGPRRRHRCAPGPRRARLARRPARPGPPRGPDGRRRPRRARPAGRRRGRRRRPGARQLEKALRDSGYLTRAADGTLRLSPRAMRELGRSLLRDVAGRLSSRQGERDVRAAGAAGEPSGATRGWEFGDTEPWDVTRTMTNALTRTAAEPPTGRDGIRLDIRDVEVTETEARTRAVVALLVDTSFSMAMDGRWVPMKRTALALHQLISTRFRGDHLELIGFGRHAEVMQIEQLTALDAMWEKGTNLHHALLLANRHFRRHPHEQPVLLVVTDGEPTSHLEPGGEVFFDYPPHPRTVALAVRELDAAARLGAQTTFFRLGEDPGLARFVESMARRAGGRVVAPELGDLGAAVVGSYLGSRSPTSPFGASYRDLFGGRGFWAE